MGSFLYFYQLLYYKKVFEVDLVVCKVEDRFSEEESYSIQEFKNNLNYVNSSVE